MAAIHSPANAHFEETLAELQRHKINAQKHTPNNRCYFLQWTPLPVKTTFGDCLLPAHCNWTDQSLSTEHEGEWKAAASVWKEFFIFLKLKSFQTPLKFYILPFCLYLCSEHLFLLWWSKRVISSCSAEFHHLQCCQQVNLWKRCTLDTFGEYRI